MKIVTLTKQNWPFDFLSILVKNRDFDLDRKNRYSTRFGLGLAIELGLGLD